MEGMVVCALGWSLGQDLRREAYCCKGVGGGRRRREEEEKRQVEVVGAVGLDSCSFSAACCCCFSRRDNISLFNFSTVVSPKWKIVAAKTASAPLSSASNMCCGVFPPPLAITGTSTLCDTSRNKSQSNPSPRPSESKEVKRI